MRYILPACSLAAGKNIEQTFAILDAKGVGIRHLTGAVKKMLQQIIQVRSLLMPASSRSGVCWMRESFSLEAYAFVACYHHLDTVEYEPAIHLMC